MRRQRSRVEAHATGKRPVDSCCHRRPRYRHHSGESLRHGHSRPTPIKVASAAGFRLREARLPHSPGPHRRVKRGSRPTDSTQSFERGVPRPCLSDRCPSGPIQTGPQAVPRSCLQRARRVHDPTSHEASRLTPVTTSCSQCGGFGRARGCRASARRRQAKGPLETIPSGI